MRLKVQRMNKLFYFYSMVIEHTENFLETLKRGNFCVFYDWVLILREKRSISYKVPEVNYEKHKSCHVWVSLENFLYVQWPWNKNKKVYSLSALSNAPTPMFIWQSKVTLEHFGFFLQKKTKSGNNRSHPLRGRKKITSEIFSENRLEGGVWPLSQKIPDFFLYQKNSGSWFQ